MSATRRDFLAGSAIALAAGALGRPVLARAWQQQPAPATPVFTPIRRNVGCFTARGGTIGHLIDPAAVVVVDSQFPDTAKMCLDGLNERSGSRAINILINTHHHDDHTLGNVVFKAAAKRILAHERAAEHMRTRPGRGAAASEQHFPNTTLTDSWREQLGDEWVRAKFYGNAHTSGDIVITFERANVAHLGDLMFNRRHPVVDRPAGASLKNWALVLDKATADHAADTVYIFGHANTGQPVTGTRADVTLFRDYLNALLAFVQAEIKTGKTRDEIVAIKAMLPGFDAHGALVPAILTAAYDELVTSK